MLDACVKALEVVGVNCGDILEATLNNICSILPALQGLKQVIALLAG
jgi:hypothetical protein